MAATPAPPPKLIDHRWALAALVFGALVIGTTPNLVRLAACGPAAAGFWRLATAAPLLLLATMAGRPSRGPGLPSRWMLAAGLAFALDLGCWHYGVKFTSIANATVLPNLTPVLVTLVSWFVLKEQPKPLFLLGMVAAVGGAVAMALTATPGATPGAHPHLGDILSVSTAVWYGLYFLCVRSARASHSTMRVMFWSSAAGAPLLLISALLLHEQILPATSLGWGAAVGLGLAHVFGQGSIAWALGRLPASTAAVTVLVQPVAAAALAYVLFHEVLTPWQAAGAAVALGGIVLAQRGAAKPAAA